MSTGVYLINIDFELSRDLNQNAEVQYLARFNMANSTKSIKFIDFKLNICQILTQVQSLPLVKSLMEELRRTSDIPYSCPIKGVSYDFICMSLIRMVNEMYIIFSA